MTDQNSTESPVFAPRHTGVVRVLVSPGEVGPFSSDEAAQALGEGVGEIIRNADIVLAPLSAGGAGTSELFTGERVTLPTTDAVGSLTEATYTYDRDTATAYIDLAAAAGFPDTDKATETGDTYGVGVLVADAQTRGAERVVLALGDALTVDGGTGILVALAANPVNADGHPVPKGGAFLEQVADLETAKLNIPAAGMEWILLADSAAGVDTSHPGLASLARAAGVDPGQPGWGAGGGVAIGLAWVSSLIYGTAHRVRVLRGVDVVAQSLAVDAHATEADFVISAGAAGQAVIRLAPEATVGIAGEAVEGAAVQAGLPEEIVSLAQLRQAGAQLAADYLRISTVQG